VTSRDTFEALPTWFNELETFTSSPDVIKVVVGNKLDKVSESLASKGREES
jgi:Ras-related protein Rab-18